VSIASTHGSHPAVGVMGRETADALAALGYKISSWTRNPKEHKGVRWRRPKSYNPPVRC